MIADPAKQLTLLRLQDLDTRLGQLEHARRTLPALAELAALEARRAEVDRQLVGARTALHDVQSEVARAESDVQLVRDRAARDRARLDAGIGTAKDMLALQQELDNLAKRQAVLEDAELEVMERAEALEADLAVVEGQLGELDASLARAQATRDEGLAGIAAEEESVLADRAPVEAELPADLVGLYDKIRAGAGGIGAAELRARRCGGCRLELNPVDVRRFAAAAPDEVLRCEECRRILVRTAESGL